IGEDRLCLNFPGRSPSDLYVWIVKHWDFLKKKNGLYYSVADAARDFSGKYGNSRGRFIRFIAAALARIFNNHRAGKK
ncbi:MAG: transcriptional regulator, partial [Treponema sp.]|nr:transcriptional regulator [Treponema sp.]